MNTADTVLMKNFVTGKNFIINTDINFSSCSHKNDVVITSNFLQLDTIKKYDDKIKQCINNRLSFLESLYWQPVINTFQPLSNLDKTIGTYLPE